MSKDIFDQKRTMAVYDLDEVKALIDRSCQLNFAALRDGSFRKKLIFCMPGGGRIYLTSKLRVLNDLGFECCNCGVQARKCVQRKYSPEDYKRAITNPLLPNSSLRFFGIDGNREEEITVDHIVPLSLGGANEVGNLIPLCSKCNSRKGNRITHHVRSMWRHRDLLGSLIKANPERNKEIQQNYLDNLKNLLFMIPSLSKESALEYAANLCPGGNMPELDKIVSKRMPHGICYEEIDDPWLSALAERSQAAISTFPRYRQDGL